MNVISNWRFTLYPAGVAVPLLNYGDEIDAEPTWPLRKPLDTINLVDSATPFLRPAGNTIYTLSWRLFADLDLDKTARQHVMEGLLYYQNTAKGPLNIEIQGITDRFWQFSQAYLTEHTPQRWMDAGTARIARGYSVTATGLVQIGP